MPTLMLKLALLFFGVSQVFAADVPECLDPNEIKEPSDGCDDCGTVTNDPNAKPCAPKPIKEPICTCKPGFARKKDPIKRLGKGNCVPVKECPKIEMPLPVVECGDGQKYDFFSGCKTCAEFLSPMGCGHKVWPACHCLKPGTLINSKLKCVPKADCKKDDPEPKCKENEEMKKAECDDCLTVHKKPSTCKVPIDAPARCTCKVGFARTGDPNALSENDRGHCVKADKCSGSDTCKSNEVKGVRDGCDTCKDVQKWKTYECVDKKKEERCVCTKGFARDATGECIPLPDCPKLPDKERRECPKPTEIWTMGTGCPKCPDADKKEPLCDGVPAFDCYCKKGLLRDMKTGDCVEEAKCFDGGANPPILQSLNETECKKKTNTEWTPSVGCEACDEVFEKKSCTPERVNDGKAVCHCKKTFGRTPDDECVTQDECRKFIEKMKCGEKEEKKKATKECDDCLTRKKINEQPSKCTVPPAEIGKETCVCKDGFARLESTNSLIKGDCVKIENCPVKTSNDPKSCKQSNEEKIKNTGCDDCESRQTGKPSKNCTRPEAVSCVCKRDFARLNGLCVKKELCPQAVDPTKCPPFEVYGLRNYCDHCYWKQAGEKCPYKKATEKGCACPTATHGRRRSGECVPFDECPSLVLGWRPEPAYYGKDDPDHA